MLDNIFYYDWTPTHEAVAPAPSVRRAIHKPVILPGLYSEDQIAERFGVTARVSQERARSKGIGGKIGRKRWFTEAQVIELMDDSKCPSKSSSGRGQTSSTSGGSSTDDMFMRLQKRETKRMLNESRMISKSGSPNQQTGNIVPLRSAKPPRST